MNKLTSLFAIALLTGCYRNLDYAVCQETPDDPRCAANDSSPSDSIATSDSFADETATDASDAADSSDSASTEADVAVDACECTPGMVTPVTGTCTGALEKKTKTCGADCKWGAETCALPKGWTAIADASPTSGPRFTMPVWTGGELILYGGSDKFEGGAIQKDGLLYRLNKNTWEKIPAPTSIAYGRQFHAAVWTGYTLFVWGGYDGSKPLSDGLEYSTASKSWSTLPTSPLTARMNSGATYLESKHKVFVWGGNDNVNKSIGDGAEYDVVTAMWSVLPASPLKARAYPLMFTNGDEVVVFGGQDGDTRLLDGAIYNPTTKVWRAIPAYAGKTRVAPTIELAGSRIFLFGGFDPNTAEVFSDGGLSSLGATPSWTSISSPSATVFPPVQLPGAHWALGNTIVIWSGATDTGFVTTGGTFDVISGTWSALDTAGAPVARAYSTYVRAGACGLVWGGFGKPGGGAPESLTDGAIYCP